MVVFGACTALLRGVLYDATALLSRLNSYGAYTECLVFHGVLETIGRILRGDFTAVPLRCHGVACDRTALTSAFYNLLLERRMSALEAQWERHVGA